MALCKNDVIDLIFGFEKSQILWTAGELGIFEELQAAEKPLTPSAIAAKIQTNADATGRLMNACVALKLLEKDIDPRGKAVFRNSVATERYLLRSSDESMRWITDMNVMYPLWGRLKECIKDGSSQMGSVLERGNNFFESDSGYYSTKDILYEFMRGMHIRCKMDASKMTRAFNLSQFTSVCDLGGATATLAVELCKTYPNMQVTVFDTHIVTQESHKFIPKDANYNIVLNGGDFFKDPLPAADLFVLSHVLHDWSENKIDNLLKKIYNSLKPGGALLILEKILTDMKDGPLDTLILDLDMMISCEGRERNEREYRELLDRHGFSDVKIKIVDQAFWYDAILAMKH